MCGYNSKVLDTFSHYEKISDPGVYFKQKVFLLLHLCFT